MTWLLLAALGMLALGGLLLHFDLAALERRILAIDESARHDRARVEQLERRSAHHQRQIEALSRDLGWPDDRAKTKRLTLPPAP